MIPTQTLTDFPVFGDSSTKVKPDDAKYSSGFVNADVLPYEWMNYLHNKASSGITDLNSGMASTEAELNAVVTAGGATPSAETNNQVITAINYLISAAEARAKLAAHPIGSLYWSSKDTDPSTLFGGTWSQIKDVFVLAAGDTYTAGTTGGSATVQLTEGMLPSHKHSIGGSTGSTQPSWTGTQRSGYFTGRPYYTTDTDGALNSAVDGTYFTFTRKSSSFSKTKNVSIGSDTYYPDKVTWTYKPEGSVGSHSHTLPTNTGSTGSGTAFSVMPPYITRYCWERTA